MRTGGSDFDLENFKFRQFLSSFCGVIRVRLICGLCDAVADRSGAVKLRTGLRSVLVVQRHIVVCHTAVFMLSVVSLY